MRLSKTALLSASLLTAALSHAVDFNRGPELYDDDVFVAAGDRIIFSANFSGAITSLTGGGDFIKNGDGVLQYNGFRAPGFGLYNPANRQYRNDNFGRVIIDEPPSLATVDGLTGNIIINQGQLQLAGYLSYFLDATAVSTETQTAAHSGIFSLTLNDNASLSFINTPLNVAKGIPLAVTGVNSDAEKVYRYNQVRNLQVGGAASGARTVLDVGPDSSYRIRVNIDDGDGVGDEAVGSIGVLRGKGDLIKIGVDAFRILGSAERDFGRVVIAGGAVVLADSSGNAITNAASVNLVGVEPGVGADMRGAAVRGFNRLFDPQNTDQTPNRSVPGYVPLVVGGASLVLESDQTIRNFQADYAMNSKPIAERRTLQSAIEQSLFMDSAGEPYTPGSGFGTQVRLNGHKLRILQERDGVYRGTIVGGGALDFIISANHRFAFLPQSTVDAELSISGEGRFVTNVDGLGTRNVRLSGNLDIFQTDAGTLGANLQGGGTVTLIASAFLNNSITGLDRAHDAELNSERQRGTVAVGRVQSEFTGRIIVSEGQTLQLGTNGGAGFNNVLSNASSIVLTGAGGRISTLNVASGIQTLNNLQADSNSQVLLGRASFILKSGSIAGDIAGIGGFIVDGQVNLTGQSTYVGPTVVKSGALAPSASLSLSSGLIMNSGRFVSTAGDQALGALYGREGVIVEMGGRNLVVGTSGDRERNLLQVSAGENIISANYLSARRTATLSDGTVLSVNNGFDGNVDVSGAGAAPDVALDAGVDGALFDFAASGLAAATRRYLYNVAYDAASLAAAAKLAEDAAAANPGDAALQAAATAARASATAARNAAQSLAFAGSISGSGNLVKVGGDLLILSGVSTYTGATLVEGGVLRIDSDSINATSGITISAAAILELNGDSSAGAFLARLGGDGGVNKIGAGNFIINADLSDFRATLRAAEGSLEILSLSTFGGNLAVSGGATLILNQETDLVSSASLSNAGVVSKVGVARLSLQNYSETATGTVEVNAGVLALSRLPEVITVAAGATLEASLTGTRTLITPVSGQGTVVVIGNAVDAILIAGRNDIYAESTLELRGVRFDLNGTTQTLGGFAGENGSTLLLNEGTLIINAPAGVSQSFAGIVQGNGTLTKNGPGESSFISLVNTHWTGNTVVNAGALEATPQALGDSVVLVNKDGTLAIRNDTATPIVYSNAMTGDGVFAKTGAGEVIVDSILVTGEVRVREGRLTSGDTSGDAVFTSVVTSDSGVFQVNMTGNRLHDSGSTAKITGRGSLAASGAHTLTLSGTQSYAGNTELLNGATLAFAAGVSSVNGIAGDATSTILMPGDLRVVQSVDGSFAGAFAGTPGILSVTGTKTLTLAGDLQTQTGLTDVVIDGGRLEIFAANTKTIKNNGALDIASAVVAGERYTGFVTGSGVVRKTGAGKMSFGDGVTTGITGNPYVLGSAGTLTVAEGVLGGVFITSGDLVVASGGALAPGNSPGTVTVNGDFTLASGGTLAIELDAVNSDKVVVTGAATIAGSLAISKDPAGTKPTPGRKYTIVTAAGGVTGAFANAGATGFVALGPATRADTGLNRVHVETVGNDLVLTAVSGMRDVDGFVQHAGLSEFVALLDNGFAPGQVQAVTDGLWGASSTPVVNNFSPLGYAAEYAMAQDGDNRTRALLHDRMEQLRYDRSSSITREDAPWEFFVVGDSTFVNNGGKTDTPTFDYKSYGGLAGIDRKMADGALLGAAAGYDSASATIHDDGGKIDMSRLAATVFYSGQLSTRWYLDVAGNLGVGLYDTKRRTALGAPKSTNSDVSFGLNGETGTILVIAENLHFTPYVSAAYTHHELSSAREEGGPSALSIDSWSQDSLRVKIGAGLNYFIPIDIWRVKFGVDANFAHELLDTDSEIRASFRSGGPKFTTQAPALPQDMIGVTPNISVEIDERSAVTFGYTYEIGLDSRSYQSLNLAFRARF